MKRVKVLLAVVALALFWVACGGDTKETAGNTNKSASLSAASNSNSAPAQPSMSSASSNANESKDAKPADDKKDEKKKDEAKTEPAKAASNVDAAGLFTANKCVGCHGADGKGNPKMKGIPDFTDAAWQKKESDGELSNSIKNGKKPIMPAFGDKLSDAEVKALVGYVRSFAKK